MSAAASFPSEAPPLCREGWRLDLLDEVASTNPLAGRLPPWRALRARVQTAGRSRGAGRLWVSDEGGLWLSAVLPCPGARSKWAILPLAAGWAVMDALERFGVRGLRLRWPNDLLVGHRKLAGLLVERFTDDTAVVGVGLNVFNQPELADPALDGATARLTDLVSGAYTLDDVARLVLRSLRAVHAELERDGFGPVADRLNLAWRGPRLVVITLRAGGQPRQGHFHGIDSGGRLLLSTDRQAPRGFDANEVAHLRELE